MMTATTMVGMDVSRDWLDGFCFPGQQRFPLANTAVIPEHDCCNLRRWSQLQSLRGKARDLIPGNWTV